MCSQACGYHSVFGDFGILNRLVLTFALRGIIRRMDGTEDVKVEFIHLTI